jgi:hypothetical protein
VTLATVTRVGAGHLREEAIEVEDRVPVVVASEEELLEETLSRTNGELELTLPTDQHHRIVAS